MTHKPYSNLLLKRISKTKLYARLRQYLPMSPVQYVDDRSKLEQAEVTLMEWPQHLKRPKVGIVRDYGPYPRWTKYRRFLENNGFEYGIYELQAHDWMEKAKGFDAIVGFLSSEWWDLQEMREKYSFLENFLGKRTYPSPAHVDLYENKRLEAYICKAKRLPFVPTYVSHSKADARELVHELRYPVVSKIVPASASMGVELVRDETRARAIVEEAFSQTGRKTHNVVFRQKNYVYFQDFVQNDGYDLRVIVVGSWLFGYYRRALAGDFRASGMNQVEKRDLPSEAMQIALRLNQIIKSSMLVVDMVHGTDGTYQIIEYSPICQMEKPEQLHVNGIAGAYIAENGRFYFRPGRYWVNELALRQFLTDSYLPWAAACAGDQRASIQERA